MEINAEDPELRDIRQSRQESFFRNDDLDMDPQLRLELAIAHLPLRERAFRRAKAHMLSTTSSTGYNLYQHLKKVFSKILDEKPENAVDLFETISEEVRLAEENPGKVPVRHPIDLSTQVALAEIENRLLPKQVQEEDNMFDEESISPLQNLAELSHVFKLTGVGLGEIEILRLSLSAKKFVETLPIGHLRFWGKIFGIEQNYYILEAAIEAEDEEEDVEEEEEDENKEKKDFEDDDFDFEEGSKEDVIPTPNWRPPPEIPKEEKGFGPNKKNYFVCNEPGKVWQKLPIVTPAQIVASRQIRKLLTGRLEAPVNSFPRFPGNESNYLRALIARITAGTQISPLGFYSYGDEENEEDVDPSQEAFEESAYYKDHYKTAFQLTEPNLVNWVHHEDYLFPQGRTVWFNPEGKGEEEEDEEDEEDEEGGGPANKEVGPSPLTSLAKDTLFGRQRAWSPRLSCKFVPKYALALMRSNRWPGAYAFAHEEKCENVYVGWGVRDLEDNFNPWLGPTPMEEFPKYLEPEETEDPTVEEEAAERAMRAALTEAEEAEDTQEEDDDEDED